MTQHARGHFIVSITPDGQPDTSDGSALGKMALGKTFHGDMRGTSVGTMLTAGSTGVKGSAAYVAVERFTGSVGQHTGSFALVHRGVMTATGQELLITIVPDSGSGNLTGISGTFTIAIDGEGSHTYELAYALT